jgi:uncharacterized membrane protein
MQSPENQDPFYNKVYSAFFEEKIFFDLKVTIIWLFLAILFIYIPILQELPLRVFFALPIVLFIPGYVLITALFPNNEDIDIIERIALSFGLSIAIVPLIGLGLNYTPFGIRLYPIVTSLTIFTIAMVLIAQYRRVSLPVENRFVPPLRVFANDLMEEFFSKESSRTDRYLSIILLIAIVAALVTTVYVIVVPKEGEKFSEFYILGEKKMAADYPSRIFIGEEYPMYIGVGNHEYRNVTYTIETFLLNMTFNGITNSSTISRMSLINSTTLSLMHNETSIIEYNLSAPDTGYNRVEFLLFNETLPDNGIDNLDRINASYRDLHLWVKPTLG